MKNEEIVIKVNKMKLLKGIGIFFIVVAVIGAAFGLSGGYGSNTKFKEMVDINIDKYIELLKGSEPSIIYVARPTCSYCQKQSPILKQVISEYDLDVYYLNTDEFEEEDFETFKNSSEKYKDGFGTPNTIIVKDNQIIDGQFGYVEKDVLVKMFKDNGFINE